jgi:hypothetical protein
MHNTTMQQPAPQEQVINVSLVEEAPKELSKKEIQQFVSATKPEESLQDIPKETNRLSDEDVSVVKEQIKRGDILPPPGANSKLQKPSKEQQPVKAQQEKNEPEKNTTPNEQKQKNTLQPNKDISLQDLTLDTKSLLSNFSQPTTQRKNTTSRQVSPSNYQAFSRPLGAGAQFISDAGSADYLPNLPDGDMTLLNAKANQFAVFVRRVAIQVFSQIRSLGWENLTRGDIDSINKFTTVIATMSDKGELLKVTLDDSSSSSRFDAIIISAAKAGTKDPNPPAAAKASDGNIKFIFKARSWSEIGAGRGGVPTERRWLLLSTGLE